MSVHNDDAAAVRPRWRPIDRAAAVVFGAIVVFHCLAVLGFVVRHGRLSVVPFYDDVSYFAHGLERLSIFDRGGLRALFISIVVDPPHAPFSTILAALGFALTPGSMFGGYALNVVWIAAFAALVWHLLAGLPPAARFGLLSAALSIPMLATAIGSFRPDVFWGLLTAGAAVILATEGIARVTRTGVFLTGILVGAAALTKPTAAPAGALVMAVGYLGAVALDLAFRHLRFGEAATRTLVFLFGVAVVITPYFAIGWYHTYHYILAVMGTDAAVWRTEGTLSFHLLYFLRPTLASQWLGWALYGAPALMAFALVLMWRVGARELLFRAVLVCAVVALAYVIPSLSPVKIGFFGSTFYASLAYAGLWAAGRVVQTFRVPPAAMLIIGVGIFFVGWRPDNGQIAMTDPAYLASDKATRAVMPAILDALAHAQDDGESPLIYSTTPGPLYDAAISYYAALAGLKSQFDAGYSDQDFPHVLSQIAKSKIFIATEDGAEGQDHSFQFPNLKHQAELIAALSHDPSWHVIASFKDRLGFRTVVFSRIVPPVGIKISFDAGFGAQEGPYGNLAKFRWLIASPASIALRASGDEIPGAIGLRCAAVVPSHVTVSDPSGSAVAEADLPGSAIGKGALQQIKVPTTGLKTQATSFTMTVTPSEPVPPGWPGPVLCASDLVPDGS